MAKGPAPLNIQSFARGHTRFAIQVLCGIAKRGVNESARVSAACALLDRGWGKPPQAHTGADGEGSIQITIRHLVEGMPDETRVIDVKPSDINDLQIVEPDE